MQNKLALYEPLAHKKNGKAKSFPVLFVLLQVFPKVQIHNIPDVDKTAAVQNRPFDFPQKRLFSARLHRQDIGIGA